MYRFLNVFALFVFSLGSGSLLAQSADDVVGVWKTEGGKSHVEIFKKDGSYYGKIVWLRDPKNEDGTPKLDKNHPEESKRKRPILGLELLSGFTYDSDDEEWEDGEIYDPEEGKTYSCVMTLEDNVLKVRGYIGFSWIGRTTSWTRVK